MTEEWFFKKFALIADAPDVVARMRKLVLELAVHGRLVPQDRNDEPASELLRQIEGHKAALARESRLRTSVSLSPIENGDGEYVLPESWTWVRFGEIMINRDGERIPVSKDERANKAKVYDYYGASGVIDKIDSFLFDKPLLLIGEDGANLVNRSTPIAFIARGKYWVNNHAHVLDGISEEFLSYIALFINAISLEPYVTGSAQPKMNQAKMNSIPVALPPIAEQRRILAKVDGLMTLCDQLEAQQQERETRKSVLVRASLARFAETPTPSNLGFLFHKSYDIPPAELRKTILTLAVQGRLVPQDPHDNDTTSDCSRLTQLVAEGLHTLPASWRWCRVEDVGEVKLGRQRAPQYHKGPYMRPYLRVQNVYEARIDTSDVKEMNFTPEEYDSFALRRGDILLNEGQSRELVGRPAIYGDEVPGACFQNTLIRFRTRGNVDPAFGLVVFRACMHNGRFQQISQQTTNIAHLSAGRFAKMEFPLPPLAEQRRIVAKVDQLMSLVDELERQQELSRTTASKLLDAIVHELTGAT